MITQAYYKFKNAMSALTYRGVSSSSDNFTATLSGVKDTSNADALVSNGIINYNNDWLSDEIRLFNANMSLDNISKVVPSSSVASDFAPTDYDIGNKISNITQLSCVNSIVDTEDGSQITVTATFSNANSSAITIKSIGLVHSHLYKAKISASDSYTDILFAELELDTPLTVPAGSGFTITAVWKNNR